MLYQSMRRLEETKMLLQTLGRHFADDQQEVVAKLFFHKADQTGQQARAGHDAILKHKSLSSDSQFERKKLA